MSEDRWVRIVDPKHVLRVGIDEEWHPAYGTYGWKTEIIIDGTTVGTWAAWKFRCRLRDVPPGVAVVDPGSGHELADPWETDPAGVSDYWFQGQWVPVPELIGSLLQHNIYRRPIAKPVSKTPQPGEWWFENDQLRVFIHSISRKGKAIFEMSDGYVASKNYWQGWHHEPACTGWDWQPPQPEAKPEPLTLEQRVEAMEERLKKLEHQVSEWEDSQ